MYSALTFTKKLGSGGGFSRRDHYLALQYNHIMLESFCGPFQIQWEAHQLPEQTKVSSYLAGRYQFTSSLLSESWLETLLRLENCTVLHGFWGPGLSMAHQELMQSRTLDPYLLMVSISSPLAHTFWFPEKMSLYIKVRLKLHPSHWE